MLQRLSCRCTMYSLVVDDSDAGRASDSEDAAGGLEEALAGWLRDQISQIEEQRERALRTESTTASPTGLDGLQRKQWLVFANNLYLLASRRRDNHDYVVAHALYSRALEAAQNVAASEGGLLLVARILNDQQAVCAILRWGQDGAKRTESEEIQAVDR